MTEARSVRQWKLPGGEWVKVIGSASLLLMGTAWGAERSVNLNVSLFSDTTYQSDDIASDWSTGLGASTGLGLGYQSGLSSLGLAYQVSLSKSLDDDASPSTRFSGSTEYRYTPLSGRWDFSLGHLAQSVSTEDSLTIDPDSYSTQQSANSSVGVNFRPGALTSGRLAVSAGATFYEDDDLNGQTATARLSLNRQLSKVSTLSASLGRTHSWPASGDETDVDSGQLGYQRRLEDGSLGGALGASRVDYGAAEAETFTGNAYRAWQSETTSTRVAYSRSVSSTLLSATVPGELLNSDQNDPPTEQDSVEDEVIEFQSLSVQDAVTFSYQSQRLCSRCSMSLSSQLARREDLKTNELSHSLGASLGAGLQISSLQSAGMGYEWKAEAEYIDGPVESQSHRVSLNWQRQMAAEWHLRAALSQAWLDADTDQERFTARLSLTYGINLAGE